MLKRKKAKKRFKKIQLIATESLTKSRFNLDKRINKNNAENIKNGLIIFLKKKTHCIFF